MKDFSRAGLAKFSHQIERDPWTGQEVDGLAAHFEGGTPLYFGPEQRWLTGMLKGKSRDEVDKLKHEWQLTPATSDLLQAAVTLFHGCAGWHEFLCRGFFQERPTEN